MVLNVRIPDTIPHFFWMMDWNQLTDDEKDLWKLIGYDEQSWMNNSLAIKKFENYDNHQQLAINKLGYEDYVWNSNFVIEDNIVEYYRKLSWNDLNKYHKELFNSVNFFESNWNKSNMYTFEELSIEKRLALDFLGFNEETWNNFINVEENLNKNIITGLNYSLTHFNIFGLLNNKNDYMKILKLINKK